MKPAQMYCLCTTHITCLASQIPCGQLRCSVSEQLAVQFAGAELASLGPAAIIFNFSSHIFNALCMGGDRCCMGIHAQTTVHTLKSRIKPCSTQLFSIAPKNARY
jgi:hypothetical protein